MEQTDMCIGCYRNAAGKKDFRDGALRTIMKHGIIKDPCILPAVLSIRG